MGKCAHCGNNYDRSFEITLDGHLHLASDPCQGGVFTSAGLNRLSPGAGLGLSVKAPSGAKGGRRR